MLRSMKEMIGNDLSAKDGTLGSIYDFYFDDLFWSTRYLVADTGNWLPGRKVLISPEVVGKPNMFTHEMPVHLTQAQIENSPPYDQDRPVSRQYEITLRDYYRWKGYWLSTDPMAPAITHNHARALEMLSKAVDAAEEKRKDDNPHLRSAVEVMGYYVEARNGEVGHVEDFLVEDTHWNIHYMLVDTRNWWPGGKKVVVAPHWIEKIDWSISRLYIDLSKEVIRNSPEFYHDLIVQPAEMA